MTLPLSWGMLLYVRVRLLLIKQTAIKLCKMTRQAVHKRGGIISAADHSLALQQRGRVSLTSTQQAVSCH